MVRDRLLRGTLDDCDLRLLCSLLIPPLEATNGSSACACVGNEDTDASSLTSQWDALDPSGMTHSVPRDRYGSQFNLLIADAETESSLAYELVFLLVAADIDFAFYRNDLVELIAEMPRILELRHAVNRRKRIFKQLTELAHLIANCTRPLLRELAMLFRTAHKLLDDELLIARMRSDIEHETRARQVISDYRSGTLKNHYRMLKQTDDDGDDDDDERITCEATACEERDDHLGRFNDFLADDGDDHEDWLDDDEDLSSFNFPSPL